MTAVRLAWSAAEWVTVRLLHYIDQLDTYVQIKAGGARYRDGAGRPPTKAQMARYRALAEQVRQGKR